jgi:hypothetical protein
MAKWKKRSIFLAGTLMLAYLGLMIPAAEVPEPQVADATPFAWDRDGYWSELQRRFEAARSKECQTLGPEIEDRLLRTDQILQQVEETRLPPDAQLIGWLEVEFFDLAPLVAACPEKLRRFVRIQSGIRTALKRRSQDWDMSLRTSRETLYRVLYGSRAAVEEVLLQSSPAQIESLQQARQEPSATPSAKVLGMTVHSGDIMLSRGTAPTSALIARGADFPGNFSHAALVHVDPDSSLASIVEAHIESGVVVSSLRAYLEDRKVRVMLLRPRADLPELREDAQLPHKAASYALERAVSSHIPYDFNMDHSDPEKLYCSEVAYDAYRQLGLELWSARSTISSPGLARWLAGFGVTHMTTLGPSDLEYDPQLSVVAEWRDLDGLWRDHLDNAVVDALLEAAENGLELDYSLPRLPLARMAKTASLILNRMGRVGPVPEGMSATAALRNQWFSSLQSDLVARVEARASAFENTEKYRAPYWRLVSFAQDALKK